MIIIKLTNFAFYMKNIYHLMFFVLSIYIHTLKVNNTSFVSQFKLDDNSILTSLSPLISRLNRLRVLSLIKTTASYIPHHALTNLKTLEIENWFI